MIVLWTDLVSNKVPQWEVSLLNCCYNQGGIKWFTTSEELKGYVNVGTVWIRRPLNPVNLNKNKNKKKLKRPQMLCVPFFFFTLVPNAPSILKRALVQRIRFSVIHSLNIVVTVFSSQEWPNMRKNEERNLKKIGKALPSNNMALHS